eukprot:591044-Prymnesium_polylepis.1
MGSPNLNGLFSQAAARSHDAPRLAREARDRRHLLHATPLHRARQQQHSNPWAHSAAMVSLDEVVVGRADRRRIGRREECGRIGKGCPVACVVEGTAGGLSPPADATCSRAGHIVSQPVRRCVAQVQLAQHPCKKSARCVRDGPLRHRAERPRRSARRAGPARLDSCVVGMEAKGVRKRPRVSAPQAQ